MPEKRIFTDSELEEMGRLTLDDLVEAIESGDQEKAKEVGNRMYQEFLSLHDGMGNWLAALMSAIYENHGEEAFYQAIRRAVETYFKPGAENMSKADIRTRVLMRVAGFRAHLQPVKVVEDDEKISMQMTPCQSGERLLKNGFYGPPCNFTMIQKAHPMTYGMTDFPIYCTHAPLQEMLGIEWFGAPVFITEPAEKMGTESCWHHIYKDPKDIPAKFYERVGKKKPSREGGEKNEEDKSL